MDASAVRLPLQRLRPFPVHLGPLLHVAEPQKECVEYGFEVHDWRVAASVNGESTDGCSGPL